MEIFLTFDYEIYFGTHSGTPAKCLIEPTRKLIQIAQKYKAKMTFFIDCGYLVALEKYKPIFPELENDYNLVVDQIRELIALGHDCQLHIHPHWEDSYYEGGKWISDVRRYKLADFSEVEIISIFKKYKTTLEAITGKPVLIYRAGGWCLQPFSKIKKAFEECDLRIDSTVFHNGYLKSETHYFDFTKAPAKDSWRFTEDLCKEEGDGKFIEIPISSQQFSPFFFWRLYILGRLFPKLHKGLGDGVPVPTKGMKKKYLTHSQQLPVSSDGYFASALEGNLKKLVKKGYTKMVIIGHPKACSVYSFEKLNSFIMENSKHNSFSALSSLL